MTRPRNPADPPLTADDPRISEWLDGRLPPAAAAEVERAVRGSPELTRLADDLRAVRGALGAMPVAEPPAGFSDRVMAAVEQRLPAAGGAGERGQSPVGDSPRRRPRVWRAWPALAAALAAGVLVAIVLNLPGPGDREVALGPSRPAVDDAWTPPAAAPAAATPVDGATVDRGAGLGKGLGEGQVVADAAEAANAAAVSREPETLRSLGGEQTAKAVAAAAPPADAARARMESDEAGAFAAAEARSGVRPWQGMAGMLVVEVATDSSRQALDRLVAASGLEANRAGDRLELVGSAAAMNAFLGELERAGVLPGRPRREAKGVGGGDQPERLVIMLVGPKRQPAPGESSP